MFTLRVVCELTEMSWRTLHDWAQRGFVVPTVRGGRGGRPSLYSARQLVGLAVGACLHQSERQASPHYVAKVVKHFEKLDAEHVLAFIGDDPNADAGEGEEWMDDADPLPSDPYTEEDMVRRLKKIAPAVRAALEAEERGEAVQVNAEGRTAPLWSRGRRWGKGSRREPRTV